LDLLAQIGPKIIENRVQVGLTKYVADGCRLRRDSNLTKDFMGRVCSVAHVHPCLSDCVGLYLDLAC
jgi:hypothetical protein